MATTGWLDPATLPVPSSILRLRALSRLESLACRVGELDARGELGKLGVALLYDARRRALEAGCVPEDTDDAVFDGLEQGRRR